MPKLLYTNTRNGDMRYLVGMDILDDFFLVETDGEKYIFLDNREIGVFAEKNNKAAILALPLDTILEKARLIDAQTNITNKSALQIIKNYGIENQEIEIQSSFPLEMADFLRSQGIALKIKDPFLPERLIKSETEKDVILDNLKRTQKAFLKIEEILNDAVIAEDFILYAGVPLTSEFLKKECERVLFEEGLFDIEGMIISCGPHGAMPHHRGEGFIRPYKSIVCDIFPWHRDSSYYADMTRTYVKGNPSKELAKLYDTVKRAQQLAIETVKAGVKIVDLHGKVQKLFLDSGYHVGDKGFVHGTGHGLGIEIHELPYINAEAGDAVLAEGNVITIEPGLYYPDLGGVRIEDVVYVTENGCENLTNYPKEFIIL